jgi:mannose-6-phosphate isomerase-like protein (cupin superfamily)
MASALLSQQMMTIGDVRSYRVADHRVLVMKRAGLSGEAEILFETHTPPAGAMPSYQQSQADESFFILEGTYTFEIDGVRSELGPGSYVFVPRGIPHAFRNTTCGVARMLVLVSPGASPESFFARPGVPELVDVILQDVA